MRHTIRRLGSAKELTLVLVLVVIVAVFSAINRSFVSSANITSIFNSAFVSGTIAIGMSCLLIGGHLDLSAGSTGMMAGVLVSLLLKHGMPWVPASLLALLFGAFTGALNAALVNGLNFTSFISTLGVSTVYSGLALVFTNAQNVPIGNKAFWELASYNIGIFPLPFIVMCALLAVYGIVLSRMRFGRRVYMIGGNAHAVRLAGINPKRISTILFINNSMISSLVGIFLASRMHMGSPLALSGSDLDAITAAVLGGVSFVGGVGNMFGVFLGIILLTSFQNGLVVVGLSSYFQIVAKGMLLIAALALDFYREKARVKALSVLKDR